MTILAYIAVGLAVLVAILLLAAAMRPNSFRVERSIDINAPADKIFPLINDYRHWGSWSPYENVDPAMQRTFSGAPSGKGSVYEWTGNKNVGRGRMEIIDTAPPAKIVIKLDFFSPFEAHNVAEFTMRPQGERDECHLGHARSCSLHGEDHAHVLQHGPHGRRPVSAGFDQHEGCRGKQVSANVIRSALLRAASAGRCRWPRSRRPRTASAR